MTIIFHKCAKNQNSTENKLTSSIKQLSRAGVFMRCTAPAGGAREKERCVCKVSEHKPKVLEKCVEWKKQNKTEQCIMGVYFQNKSPDTEKKMKIKRLQVKKQERCFWLTQTHGCLRAWSAVIRLAGLIVNIWLIRFLASGVTVSHSGEGNWRRRKKKKNVTFCIYYIEFNGKKNDLKMIFKMIFYIFYFFSIM